MIKEKLGGRLDGWIQALFPFLFARRVSPDLLSVVGALVSLCAVPALAQGSLRLGGVLILAGGFFDLVDGVVARHHGISTSFGAFLDSTLDRLVDMAILLGIVVYYKGEGRIDLVVAAGVALVASVLTSYAKARAEALIPSLDVGFLERGERIVLIALGALLGLLPWALWVVAAGGTLTVIQRVMLARRELVRLDAKDSRAPEPAGLAGAEPTGLDAEEMA